MIPPFFLDVQPHHYVLDLCASPGSKTCQLIEFLHSTTTTTASHGDNDNDCDSSKTTGLVIANDVDCTRCNLLNHQTKRALSPNVIITQHDARHFPNIPIKNTNNTNPKTNASNDNDNDKDRSGYNHVRFDRILCDVPCSGDGTFRKNVDIWNKWKANAGNWHRLMATIIN